MVEKMQEKSAEFIEAKCLEAANAAHGVRGELTAVRIGPLKPAGSAPNWEVLGFTPDLPELAKSYAMKAIAPLRQKYALASNRRR